MYRWVFLKTFLVIPWSVYSSPHNYAQLSFSEKVLIYSEETVHSAHITTMYSLLFLRMSLLFRLDTSYYSHYYNVQLRCCENVISYSEDIVHPSHISPMYRWFFLKMSFRIARRLKLMLTLLLCTADLFWKCYSDVTVHSSHISTMYRWFFLKVFLVIPWRQFNHLTLQLCSNEFFWKIS